MGTTLRKVQYNEHCDDPGPCPSAVDVWGRLQTSSLKLPLFHCVESHLTIHFHKTPQLLTWLLFIYLNLLPDCVIWGPVLSFSVLIPCLFSVILIPPQISPAAFLCGFTSGAGQIYKRRSRQRNTMQAHVCHAV